jgi:hypothetical protein
MIPGLIDIGSPAPWAVLPPGIYDATLAEIGARFATTPHRQWLFDGFINVVGALQLAGCRTVYIDGSFTTGKPHPSDFDGCWELDHVDPSKLDPVLRTFANKREAQKKKYQGEMFPASWAGAPGMTFLQLFQIEKFSGAPKGILRVSLPASKGATP